MNGDSTQLHKAQLYCRYLCWQSCHALIRYRTGLRGDGGKRTTQAGGPSIVTVPVSLCAPCLNASVRVYSGT